MNLPASVRAYVWGKLDGVEYENERGESVPIEREDVESMIEVTGMRAERDRRRHAGQQELRLCANVTNPAP